MRVVWQRAFLAVEEEEEMKSPFVEQGFGCCLLLRGLSSPKPWPSHSLQLVVEVSILVPVQQPLVAEEEVVVVNMGLEVLALGCHCPYSGHPRP
jgi:hypothetical protein